uniref:Olfactomedin-like domain-containing protein n=1 Tax=Setaria digitata TaxID=48799 RepID=A0A915PPB4_9BILA
MSTDKSKLNRSVIIVLAIIIILEAIIIGILIGQQPSILFNQENDAVTCGRVTRRIRRDTRTRIRNLEDSTARGSIDLSSSALYVPIYAQISEKSLKSICEERSKRRKKHRWKHSKNITNFNNRLKRLNKRGCGLISSISQPRILARRLNKIGGIVRHGKRWFQTEYALGYNVFEYNNLIALRLSHPSAIHSLDNEQFDGTDNTACNKNTFIYYASGNSHIYSYQIDKQHSTSISINASKIPIYNFSYSYLDLENDDEHLWILYHSLTDGTLRASLRDCFTLVERKSWILKFLNTNTIVNAFIACDHLYTVTQNDTSNILKVIYHFGTGKFFDNTPIIGIWKRYGIPSNVQYDYMTKTINVFDDGFIYSITVRL